MKSTQFTLTIINSISMNNPIFAKYRLYFLRMRFAPFAMIETHILTLTIFCMMKNCVLSQTQGLQVCNLVIARIAINVMHGITNRQRSVFKLPQIYVILYIPFCLFPIIPPIYTTISFWINGKISVLSEWWHFVRIVHLSYLLSMFLRICGKPVGSWRFGLKSLATGVL